MGPWTVQPGDLACVPANSTTTTTTTTTTATTTTTTTGLGGVPTPGQGCLYGGGTDISTTRAQQNFVISVGVGNETTFVWTGDRWQQAPDGLKGHEGQFWAPLSFDDDGRIGPVRWVDEFELSVP